MKVLFVHDHKFPYKDGIYFHSYGFDAEFFNRYLLVFDELEIIGRDVDISLEESKYIPRVESNIKFLTLKGFGQLKSRKIREDIDKKIASSNYVIIRLPSILGLYAMQRAKSLKKPFLIEVVGSAWDSLWYQSTSKKIFAPVMSGLCKKAISTAPFVVYVTEKFLQGIYPTVGQSISCSNVTLPNVSDSINERLENIKNSNSNKKLIVGTCASLNIYKGQQDIIQAISKLKSQGHNIEYQLVGGGDQSFLKSKAISNGVEEEVKFLGKLNHNDVFSWLDKIDIYVQPSLTEGMPRAVIEAMSRGCPILGSNAGGIPELIDDEFVFEKGNIDSFCTVFNNLTPRVMEEQAKRNHSTSKKYLKSVLYDRRTKFLEKFIEESLN